MEHPDSEARQYLIPRNPNNKRRPPRPHPAGPSVDPGLNTLLTEGSLESQLPNMQHRADLYDLVDYAEYTEFDASIFNFTVVPRS